MLASKRGSTNTNIVIAVVVIIVIWAIWYWSKGDAAPVDNSAAAVTAEVAADAAVPAAEAVAQ